MQRRGNAQAAEATFARRREPGPRRGTFALETRLRDVLARQRGIGIEVLAEALYAAQGGFRRLEFRGRARRGEFGLALGGAGFRRMLHLQIRRVARVIEERQVGRVRLLLQATQDL